VAGNEHGRRVVAWARNGGVFVRIAPRGGRFGPRRRVAGPAHNSDVRVAIDERGNIALVWSRFVDADPDRPHDEESGDFDVVCCSRLMGAVLRRGGRLTHRAQVGVRDAVNSPGLLSTDGSGHLSLAFTTAHEDPSEDAVHARFGTMRRGFGRLRLMSPPGESGSPVRADRGRVVYATYPEPRQTVETSRDSAGRLVRTVLLDFPIGPGQLGADDSGRQTGAWESGAIATRIPPGPFDEVGRHEPGPAPLVSVTGSGAGVVVWQVPGAVTRVMATVRPPGMGFGPDVELDRIETSARDQVTVVSADVARDGSAAVAVVASHNRDPVVVDPILEPRLYLVPPGGGAADRLVLGKPDSLGVQVLRDARGTLAVVPTRDGFVARWMR
jgi:hypothetical protein